MIENKFLHYLTYNAFKTDLDAGKIDQNSIVFIKDQGVIWTHGKEYAKSSSLTNSSSEGNNSQGGSGNNDEQGTGGNSGTNDDEEYVPFTDNEINDLFGD